MSCSYGMVCNGVTRYVVFWHVEMLYGMAWYDVPCYDVLCCVMLCYVVLWAVIVWYELT